MSFLNAQDITDAVRFSNQDILGTARYRGMSGAFGALGGDLSSLQVNPAGSAVFLNSSGSITLSSGNVTNDVNYTNDFNSTSSNNLNFNQFGAVFVYKNRNESSKFNKLSLGITYDQTTDFTETFNAIGRSSNSIDSFFLSEAQGLPLDLITVRSGESINETYSFLGETEGFGAQQAFLGHESLIIEADDPTDPDSDARGGNLALNATAEIRFPLPFATDTKGLKGSVFVDAGNVFADDFDADEIRYSAGVGLTWVSPLGPLSLSYAKPLNAEDDDQEQRLQFSIGANF